MVTKQHLQLCFNALFLFREIVHSLWRKCYFCGCPLTVSHHKNELELHQEWLEKHEGIKAETFILHNWQNGVFWKMIFFWTLWFSEASVCLLHPQCMSFPTILHFINLFFFQEQDKYGSGNKCPFNDKINLHSISVLNGKTKHSYLNQTNFNWKQQTRLFYRHRNSTEILINQV